MRHKVYRFYMRPNGPRPDFRLVQAFLWHDSQNVDTDGDADNPASRAWTYLFLCNRDNEAEMVMVDKVGADIASNSLLLEIKSEREYLAARCAYFLAVSTGADVSETGVGVTCSPDTLVGRMGAGFDLAAAAERVYQSPYSRSTLENPYPKQ